MASSFLKNLKSYASEQIRTKWTKNEIVLTYNKLVTDDPWGPSVPEMDELLQLYPQGYYDMLPEMQLHLDNRKRNWTKCYKTLLVIEHFARNVDERYLEDLRAFVPTLRDIESHFQYVDSGGVDRGINIRVRAQKVAQLLLTPDMLAEERQKAAKLRTATGGVAGGGDGRFAGFGSTSGHSAPAPSTSASSSSSAASNRFGGFAGGSSAASTSNAAGSTAGDAADESPAEKQRREQEVADRRLAEALQEEENARARVAARRAARGEPAPASPTQGQTAVSTGAAGHDDDDFGELQAVESQAEQSRKPTAAAPATGGEDDFGAFVATRSSDSAATAPSTSKPAAAAPADLDSMFASPAPVSSPPQQQAASAAPSIDDIFGGPAAPAAPASRPQQQQQQSSGATMGGQLDMFAGIGPAGQQQQASPTLGQMSGGQQRTRAW